MDVANQATTGSPPTADGAAKRSKLVAVATATSSSPVAVNEEEINITTLPEWAIREVIDYIPKTSRALLALALTTDSASWRDIHWNKSTPKSILSWFRKGPKNNKQSNKPSAITKVVLSPKNEEEENLWEEINFADNDRDLCRRLDDDDIAGMLACINAVEKLQRLYLTWCESITGRALEPLRGSVVLEKLDLNTSGNNWKVCLKETDVIPILDSIIGREIHSLKYIHFPAKWRNQNPFSPRGALNSHGYFTRFLQRYNETEQQQSIRCQNCGANCREHLSLLDDNDEYFGIQANTCYDCLSHYCYNCMDEEDQFYLTFCVLCEKFHCKSCVAMKSCRSCRNSMCIDCVTDDFKCNECGDFFCDCCNGELKMQCSTCYRSGCRSCTNILVCEDGRCKAQSCNTCQAMHRGKGTTVQECSGCHRILCITHRLSNCKPIYWSGGWRVSCQECVALQERFFDARAYIDAYSLE